MSQPRDPAVIQAEIDALRSKRASGMRTVKEGDNLLEMRKDVELSNAIAALEAELAIASGKRRPNVILMSYRSGR